MASYVERVLPNCPRGGFPLTDDRLPGYVGGRHMKLACRTKRCMWDSHSPLMVGLAYDNIREHWEDVHYGKFKTVEKHQAKVSTFRRCDDHGCRVLWEDES
jgi:hypothetical protein